MECYGCARLRRGLIFLLAGTAPEPASLLEVAGVPASGSAEADPDARLEGNAFRCRRADRQSLGSQLPD